MSADDATKRRRADANPRRSPEAVVKNHRNTAHGCS